MILLLHHPVNFLIQNKDIIDVLLNILDTIILILATVLSIYGFRTWRIELKGKTKFELSKNIIATAYKIRDRINQVRNPFVSIHEFKDREKKGYETQYQERASDSFFAFTNRFNELQKQLDEWYSLKIEAEAIFGKDHRQLLDKLDEICSDLWWAIKLFHENKYHNNFDDTKHKKYENIIYGIYPGKYEKDTGLDNTNGGFQERFNKVINEIQSKFETHL
ncbi:hypothetical protein A8B79_04225 [Balneola sp. EhC07]|uniref:hypothetical protein n=1 Tax=Balneola sp. EhC07 TaxID=1849360 RepID=UPI0007F485A1|nr:hypothetical protein [Balneola sp. EhC07]OAN62151.1 hypothetical protein A8B79_04225 [Balneola sp. EhC07]